MSMSNFIGVAGVRPFVMAVTTPSGRKSTTQSGTGMAHLTVVPTNFAASDRSTDESDD
jgi:hypothetical protein